MAIPPDRLEASGALVAAGVCSTGPRAPWMLGRWRLDDAHLEFVVPGRTGGHLVPLPDVCRLSTGRRKYVLTAKRILVVTYRPRVSSRPAHLWLLTGDLPAWHRRLSARTSGDRPDTDQPPQPPALDLAALDRALRRAPATTAQALDLLAAGGPRTPAALAALLELDARSASGLETSGLETAISARFADIDHALGLPALRYVRRRLHVPTGAVHERCWWLDDRVRDAWLSARSPVEVQVSGGRVTVITEVPAGLAAGPPSVRVHPDGSGLTWSIGRGHERHVWLPVAVHGTAAVTVGPTGVVVIEAGAGR